MLIKLNKGEHVSVSANHSEDSNIVTLICHDGKKVYGRDFGLNEQPQTSLNKEDSQNDTQQLKAKISGVIGEMKTFLPKINGYGERHVYSHIEKWVRKLSAL